jgi:hypothetical protein
LYLALIIHPRHSEHHNAFGFHHPLQDFGILKCGMRAQDGDHGLNNFANGLEKDRFVGVFRDNLRHEFVDSHDHWN